VVVGRLVVKVSFMVVVFVARILSALPQMV
jgi:hypothetical protein